jgi:pimeloyl-ACP methyl ester carboxylesterase
MTRIATHDGLSLEIFATELKHDSTIVFVNALGIASAAAEPLSKALFERGFNFVAWNGRGIPGDYDERFRCYETPDLARDLAAVVGCLRLRSFVLAAWCTGINTALAFAADALGQAESLVLFNAPNYSPNRLSGVSGDAIGKISEMLVSDENKLDFIYRNILGSNTEQVQARMTGITDRQLQRLVQAPFSSGKEALLRYAYLIKNSSRFKPTADFCRGVTQPTVIVGGRRDTMVSYEDSIALSRLLPDAVAKIFDDWDHYTVFSRPDLVADIVFGHRLAVVPRRL